MTILYSCRHDGDQYRISKWDDGELLTSYLCTTSECECPAGVKPNCRHREMLPRFIDRNHVNTGLFFDFDRGGWVRMFADEDIAPSSEPEPITATEVDARIAAMNGPANTVAEPLVDCALEILQEHDLLPAPSPNDSAEKSWRRF